MASETVIELLEQLVMYNRELVEKVEDLVGEVREIKEELNWIGEHSLAQQLVEGMGNIERAISDLDLT